MIHRCCYPFLRVAARKTARLVPSYIYLHTLAHICIVHVHVQEKETRARVHSHTHTYIRRYVFTCIGNQRQRRRTDERDGQTLFTGSNAGQNKIETRVRWNDRFQEDKPPEASATRFAGPVAMDHIGP